jgi:hypothetical protein
MKFPIVGPEEFSRTVVYKKHCDFTETQIDVGYRSKFKMDKSWYKFDIWELLFPFGNRPVTAPATQTTPHIRYAGEFAGHSRRLDSHRCRSWSTFDMRSSERC